MEEEVVGAMASSRGTTVLLPPTPLPKPKRSPREIYQEMHPAGKRAQGLGEYLTGDPNAAEEVAEGVTVPLADVQALVDAAVAKALESQGSGESEVPVSADTESKVAKAAAAKKASTKK